MISPETAGGRGAIGSMKEPQLVQNCSSAATFAPQLLQVWETKSLL
jgi:hypothetical protein